MPLTSQQRESGQREWRCGRRFQYCWETVNVTLD